MRLIHLLRKPFSEGTVAANALKHGVGGLNIAASRVAAPGETIANHSRGDESAISKGIYGDSKGQHTHQTEGQKLGRWPANVILQHLDGCRREGTKKVRSPMRRPTGKPIYATEGSAVEWNANNVRDTTVRGHADEDGNETIANWVCKPGCPVAVLDARGGSTTSKRSMRGVGWSDSEVFGVGDPGFDTKRGYDDEGGVSRFYKQIGGEE